MEILSTRLKTMRDKNKMTQEDLANVLHINRSTVASWETGRRTPDYKNLVKLARCFNVSAAYFIDEDAHFIPDDLLRKNRAEVCEMLSQLSNRPQVVDIIREVVLLPDEELDEILNFINELITHSNTSRRP